MLTRLGRLVATGLCVTGGIWIASGIWQLGGSGLTNELAEILRYGTALIIAGLLLAAVSYATSDDEAIDIRRLIQRGRDRPPKEGSDVSTL